MTPARWKQVEEAFDRVVDLVAAEREAELAALRARDNELHAEVVSLLANLVDSDAVLRKAIEEGAAQLVTDTTTSRIGGRVGAYRLVGLLGEGGMGSVYRAVRDDAEYRSEVAVKVLRHGVASAQAIARFRDERQILAALDHPGIVRLLDGGTTDGVPYLVLEHVEGVPITRYAREHQLSPNACVELMVRVCEAVQYAHQRLVVHRDIKPSNILVGERGAPKLLDFGIAKLLDDNGAGDRQARTRTGMALFTPEYASPEQARGEVISTATDVYSLGAVLYELLCDVPAHAPTTNALEALRIVCEVEPPAPSTVAPRDRRAALVGDLDNIVQKALHKEPARRYASVEQLADDLRRYLDGRPVLARPATLGYRTSKFVKHHRGKLAIALAVAAALVTATVWSLHAARRADREADRAARRFAEGRKLANTLVFEIEAKISALKGSTGARELIVRSAAGYLDGLAADASDDPGLSRELASAYMQLGDIEGSNYDSNLGRARDAVTSYEKAGAILDRMTEERDAPATQRTRALYLVGAGLVTHAAGESERGMALVRQGLALAESLPPAEQPSPVPLMRGYTALLFLSTDLAAAKADSARGAAIAARWRAREPTSPDARYWNALFIEADAEIAGGSAEPERAARDLRESVAILRALVAEYPEDANYARDHAIAMANLAGYLGSIGGSILWRPDIGDLDGAIETTRATLPLFEDLRKRDPEDARIPADYGGQLSTLGAFVAKRDPAASVPFFEQSLAVYDGLPPDARTHHYTEQMEWFLHCAMAAPLVTVGRRDEADAHAKRGLELATKVGYDEKGGDTLSMCRYLVAEARHELGQDAVAAELLEANLTSLAGALRKPSPTIAAYIGLVASLERLAVIQPARACELAKRAADVWRGWRYRSTFVEQKQDALDHAAACTL